MEFLLQQVLAELQKLNEMVGSLQGEVFELRGEVFELHGVVRELREELLPPARVLRAQAALRTPFITALILTAQNGFGLDVLPFLALCRETWGEEILWDAVKDLRLPGKKRTRLMHAVETGDVGRLRWLLARGAQVELKDERGATALLEASKMGRLGVVQELLARGAAVDTADSNSWTPLNSASGRVTWMWCVSCSRGAPQWTP